LVLSSNQFIGEIPPEIGNLTNLTGLFLNNNQLTGRIPSEIGNLINLTNLDLSDNELTEEIPPEIGNLTNLFQLLLNNNQLMGEIPESICNIDIFWISFPYFDIDNNQLCPPYPDCISEEDIGYQDTSECSICNDGYTEIDGECYYQSDLDVVQDFIDSNESLYGYSPLTLTNTINWLNGHLGSFLLYDRGITTIPESIGNLDSLDMIYFFENEIESVPESIGNLINLRFLDLGRNNISNIPDTIWGLENLTTLNFQENQLTSISDEVCNIYSNLEYGPFLSMNQICPPYPECLTEENIGYQDTSECLYIGDECFTDDEVFGYYDCDLCCQTSELIDNWLGDGVCDMYLFSGCSEIFPNFDCYELGYDCGDCESYGGTPWDGSDPLGFCYECIIGDVNNDSILNILDIVSMITLILDGEYHECGDVNSDGVLNILDVVIFVNIILSIP
jgi:Leucine-rich repeat (LRR) protein